MTYRLLIPVCLFALSGRAADWPTFRGHLSSGVAANQRLPDTWDGAKGANIRWKVLIPGLAHSSPILSGDRIFVTGKYWPKIYEIKLKDPAAPSAPN